MKIVLADAKKMAACQKRGADPADSWRSPAFVKASASCKIM